MEKNCTMSILSYKTYVSQVGGFQELLRRARTKVEEIGRPETQDPGVDFVPHLWENPNKYKNTETSNATNACCHVSLSIVSPTEPQFVSNSPPSWSWWSSVPGQWRTALVLISAGCIASGGPPLAVTMTSWNQTQYLDGQSKAYTL